MRILKSFLVFVFVFFVFSSVVFAVSPFKSAEVTSEGLVVEIAPLTYLMPNMAGELHVHVYNQSNGVLMDGSVVSCEGVIHDVDGTDLLFQNATIVEDHFKFTFNNTLINSYGQYSYNIHCNSTYNGGFFTGSFDVNPYGFNKPLTLTGSFLIGNIVVMMFLVIGLFLLGRFNKFVYFKWSCFVLVGLEMLVMLGFVYGYLANLDTLWIIKMNFWIFGFLTFGIILFSFFTRSIDLMNFNNDALNDLEMEKYTIGKFDRDKFGDDKK